MDMRQLFWTKLLILGFFQFYLAEATFELKDADTPGVKFSPPDGNEYYVIDFDEKNTQERVTLALIENSDSDVTYNVENKLNGQYWTSLGFQVNTTEKTLTANTLDFESLNSPDFYIFITETNDATTEKRIQLKIINLDDETPQIAVDRCNMEENDKDATCNITLYDADGLLDEMTFKIININTDDKNDELFRIDKPTINDNKQKTAVFYLKLQEPLELDYEEEIIYSFTINVIDTGANEDSKTMVVNVLDMPDMPPYFTSFVPTQRIREKQPYTTDVKAKDGDVIINAVINYRLNLTNKFVTIDETTGKISVEPIDRDAGNDQVVFTITAYEKDDPDSSINGEITLLIEDIDDNIPEFIDYREDKKIININIYEKEVEDIENKIFTVTDIDTGENAIFTLEIDTDNPDFKDNFNIVPNKGYETIDISIIVKDSLKLDYENPDWQHIIFDIVSKGTKTPANTDKITIDITLKDWNDESPIFDPTEYTAQVKENIKENEEITIIEKNTIQATDLDAEDISVKHEILGSLQTSLSIEEYGGKIQTLKNSVFDYEKQTEVFVQIQATDLANHRAIAQLTITVIDVNDENPKFEPVSQITINENQKEDTSLDDADIRATDVDTKCNLEFLINWEKSRAVKNLQEYTDFQTNYKEFLIFETQKIDDHTFKGNLKINEVMLDNTPDFEKFDTVYLSILVNDTNTEEGRGTDEAIITIIIGNLNDNKPEFTGTTTFTVVENSLTNISIGVALATDADNLEPLTYTIAAIEPDTEGLVKIDSNTGQITTTENLIDCDDPVREFISYTVTVSDTELTAETEIRIDIIDLNDNSPTLQGDSKSIVEDFYNTPSTHNQEVLFNLSVIDKDRSAEYNAETVDCTIFTGDTDRFGIGDNKKEVIVNLKNDIILDREFQETYQITIQCYDNPSRVGGGTQNSIGTPPVFNVTLTDLNDWTPTILPSRGTIQTNENLKEGGVLDSEIEAEDKDKEEAGIVKSSVNSIKCSDGAICRNSEEDISDLFRTIDVDGEINKIQLQASKDLRSFYGKYDVEIKVEDTPSNGEKSLSSLGTVQVEVLKFNFEIPSFPTTLRDSYYLDPNQRNGESLTLSTNGKFPPITATDNQDNKYTFTYTVKGSPLFGINSNSEANLIWIGTTNSNENEDVTVTITATIQHDSEIPGEALYSIEKEITFSFFSMDDTDPQFEQNTIAFNVIEETTETVLQIPQADYKGIDLTLDKFYLIKDQSEFFNVDSTNGSISLKIPLDYETRTVHELIIYASNSDKIRPQPNEKSILTVTINVVDINDNPPVFEHEMYFSTIVVGSNSRTSIIQVKATDIDTVGSTLTYTITKEVPPDSFSLNGPYFNIDPNSGMISVNFVVTEDMSGYFDVSVCATDAAPENNKGESLVRIHIVNKENTVNFKFENPSEAVADKISNIEEILTSKFSFATNAESPSRDSTSDGERTIVPIYFIDEDTNIPILGTEILKLITSAQTFAELKASFLDETSLILLSFESTGGNETNTNEMLKAWLIGITVLLGGLIIVLIVAFILRNRSLTNRIKNLSSTKFGSQESGLNRLGLAIPTANRNAVEGANPVYNRNRETSEYEEEEKRRELDQENMASGDSDLIGVEDNPEFDLKGEPETPKFDLQY